ncbi:MAG TPA: phosphotransferase, partial [Blastocatellia bacterium]
MINNQEITSRRSALDCGPISDAVLELASRLLAASPNDLAVSKLAGDASSRIYYRIARSHNQNGSTGQNGNAESLVLVQYAGPFDEAESAAQRLSTLELASPSARLTFASDPCAQIEVTRLFLEAGLPVPRIAGVDGDEGVILFEDLGDLRLQDWLDDRPPDDIREAYDQALKLLVMIQDSTERVAASKSICSRLAFDKEKLEWELNFFLDNYFCHYCSAALASSMLEQVRQDVSELSEELASAPRVLTHRDYHARNLMINSGKMYIIDHQDARMGPQSYDLVSLLYDPYARLQPELIDELRGSFIGMTQGRQFQISDRESFEREFD